MLRYLPLFIKKLILETLAVILFLFQQSGTPVKNLKQVVIVLYQNMQQHLTKKNIFALDSILDFTNKSMFMFNRFLLRKNNVFDELLCTFLPNKHYLSMHNRKISILRLIKSGAGHVNAGLCWTNDEEIDRNPK